MSKTNSVISNDNRWQPSDFKSSYPILPTETDKKRAGRKKLMLVSVYLILLVGSLFIL